MYRITKIMKRKNEKLMIRDIGRNYTCEVVIFSYLFRERLDLGVVF